MADRSPSTPPALGEDLKELAARAVSQPLVTHSYTADQFPVKICPIQAFFTHA